MNRIPEKKIQTYKNPEHSDKDLKNQFDELAKSMIAGTYDPYVGTVMGKPVRRSQLKHNGTKQTYEVEIDGSIIEVDPKHIQFSNDIKADTKSGYDYDAWRADYLDYTGCYIDTDVPYVKVGGPSDSSSQDPLHARVEAGPWMVGGLGTKVTGTKTFAGEAKLASGWDGLADYGKPWDDPLKSQIDKAENTVACMDMPEWRPDCDPNAQVKIYYHDRFPSIPVREIVNDAILMLRAKKRLNISLHSFRREGNGSEFRLVIKVLHDNLPPVGSGKIIECLLNKKCFDRMKCEADRYAKLRAKLDTNTYLKLRVAWLLYQAQKLSDQDASRMVLDVFRVVSSSTHPIFKF